MRSALLPNPEGDIHSLKLLQRYTGNILLHQAVEKDNSVQNSCFKRFASAIAPVQLSQKPQSKLLFPLNPKP